MSDSFSRRSNASMLSFGHASSAVFGHTDCSNTRRVAVGCSRPDSPRSGEGEFRAVSPTASSLRATQRWAAGYGALLRVASVSLATLLAACTGTITYDDEIAPLDPDAPEGSFEEQLAGSDPSAELEAVPEISATEAAILDLVAQADYRTGDQWVQINSAPFKSAVADGSISVWVSAHGADAYSQIAMDLDAEPTLEVPPETLIVREVYDAEGALSAITLMRKGQSGYNPNLGDFWFAALEPDGTPKFRDTGEPRMGRMSECYSCHVPRQPQGYLFGVPSGNRSPGMGAEL